jgi:signal transduction histidine kinase
MMTGSEKANLLVVDDEPERLLAYEAILERLDQNILRSESGERAIALAREREIAAVLIDAHMPGADSFETAAELREIPGREDTPIIFVAGAHLADTDRLRGYKMGAADYVDVPVVPEILRGKVRRLVEFFHQRKELSRLNQQLSKTNSRLTSEIRERRNAELMLADAAKRKDDFISMLAHELRNPLSAIQSGIEVMRIRPLPKGKLAWARALVERQLQHLVRLIDDLLDVSRITNGRVRLKKETVELAAVIRQSLDAVHPIVEERRHEIVLNMPRSPVYVRADAIRLTQVFGNLLTNASKYMEIGGKITVNVEFPVGDGRTVAVSVRDEGAGLSKDMLDHVFELFAQANPTGSRTPSGLGIGLALVRSLVEMHGGKVRASSKGPGQGAEFSVELPTCEARPQLKIVESPHDTPSESIRLLIIDDNIDSAQGLAVYLETNSHYQVRIAEDGLKGVDAALEFLPEVVLLDIGLPDIDGYEVARRLKSQSRLDKTRIVAITGFGSDSDRRRAEELSFDSFLVKPIDLAVLESVIADFTGRRSGEKRTAADRN